VVSVAVSDRNSAGFLEGLVFRLLRVADFDAGAAFGASNLRPGAGNGLRLASWGQVGVEDGHVVI